MFDIAAIKQSFGEVAGDYDRHALLQRQVRAYAIKLAKAYVPAQAVVLDAGCGTGALLEDIKALRLRWQVVGLDIAPGMCAHAGQKSTMVVNANADAMPLAGESVDAVISSLMLQWTHTPQRTFQEMARVLNPDGICVIATLAAGTLHELHESFAAWDKAPHVSDFLEPHRLLAYAEQAGFHLVNAKQAKVVEYYSDAIVLMRALQDIGATNKQASRRKGLMTPKQFAAVERAYDTKFRQPEGLPATWQILYMVLQK